MSVTRADEVQTLSEAYRAGDIATDGSASSQYEPDDALNRRIRKATSVRGAHSLPFARAPFRSPTTGSPAKGAQSIQALSLAKLECDAIVNAANKSLLGGGGVDGAIHSAAGSGLYDECKTLNGCDTGDAKMTGGHRLPAKHILHAVGPIYNSHEAEEKAAQLKSCYQRCLELATEHKLRHVAFNCISTGIYGYPIREATEIALQTTRKYLLSEAGKEIQLVIFVIFLPKDLAVYHSLAPVFFPPALGAGEAKEQEAAEESNEPPREADNTDAKKAAAADEDPTAAEPRHTLVAAPVEKADMPAAKRAKTDEANL